MIQDVICEYVDSFHSLSTEWNVPRYNTNNQVTSISIIVASFAIIDY